MNLKDGKVSVAVVGYGYWGPNLVRNYLECPNATIRYICDTSPKQLEKASSRYPWIPTTDDFEVIVNDQHVDAVLIATPISTHYALAKRAILKKKHVFVEKPLAASSKEAKRLIGLAGQSGVTLMVGHTFEYSPPVRKIKELISDGELGKIYYISSSRINLGLHQKDASVVWDLAPHDFSVLFYWLEEEPSKINVFGRACIRAANPDVAFLNLNFPSGVVAQVQLSWLSPIKLRRTIIVGSQKMLLYDDTENVERVKVFDHGVRFQEPQSFGEFQLSYRSGDIVSPKLDNYEPLFAEAQHFLECVQTGKTPVTGGESGLRVVKALELAENSLKENGGFEEEAPWLVYPVQS